MNYNRKEQLQAMNRQIKELSGVYRSALSRLGLSENEFWIWYALLIMEEEYSQQDLCDAWSLSKQTVNTIITGMVKKGYVELRVVPGTRNRKIICVTDAGRSYGEQIIIPIAEAEQRAIEKVPMRERWICSAVLNKYIGFLKEELDYGTT